MHFLESLLKPQSGTPVLWIENRNTLLASSLETAFDSESRKKGLLGREGLAEGTALVIAPCSAVHTFAMRFPIDVIFVRKDGHVLKIRRAMPAARLSAAVRAFAVIEMCAGSAERVHLQAGDRLVVR